MSILKFNYHTLAHKKNKPELSYQWGVFTSELAKLGLSPKLNEQRVEQIFYSRLCLKNCLKTKGIDILWRDLLSRNYLELQNFVHSPLSLSHSKERSLAVVAQDSHLTLIGADIEHEQRVLSSKIQKYIASGHDINIEPIKLWCIKEAGFKAMGKMGDKIPFRTIQVQADYIEINSTKLSWKIYEENSHILAICWK